MNHLPRCRPARFLTFLLLAWLGLAGALRADTSDLEDGFISPPDSAATRTWWHWMNGNVTREGITADLEAMHRVGIRGATIVVVGLGMPDGPVRFGSPQFYDMVKFAAQEAQRVGIHLGIENCAGWSSSGGPWVKPEYSMQNIVESERQVTGPSHFSGDLPKPPSEKGYYRDVRIVAFPALEGESTHLGSEKPTVTASVSDFKDPATPHGYQLPYAKGGNPPYLQFEFAQPFAARTLLATAAWDAGGRGELQASDDGQTFHSVRSFFMHRHAGQEAYALPATTARFYRLVFTSTAGPNDRFKFNVDLRPTALLDEYLQKTGGFPSRMNDNEFTHDATPTPPGSMVVHLDQTVDLTAKVDAAGHLDWDVPAGPWTILRLGCTTNGMTNHPAAPDGTGLEVDKLSRAAARAYWAGMFDPIRAKLGPLLGTALDHTLIDSYEVGGQNWSPELPAEFKKRRGYDLLPYLPIFTGRIVESPEVSERVLWDLRRTIADLFADNYFSYFTQLAHQDGLKMEVEPYGEGPFEDVMSAKEADRIMGEFWWGQNGFNSSPKLAASAAHIYGKTLVGAESFTSGDGGWDMSPPTMKALGDEAYAAGINSFTFHRYAMQPWLNRWPGMTMAIFGSNLERTNTWWEQGRAWQKYCARCQFLLQQGLFVGDVLFADGEGAPCGSVQPSKEQLPEGYDYDTVTTDVIMNRLSVQDGRLVLPNGARYRVLVLTGADRMTPGFVRKLKELADAGATILGPKPVGSPSLTDYAQADGEVKKLADELWDSGKIAPEPVPATLAKLQVAPDFEPADPGVKFLYLHRATRHADIYFVSNQSTSAQEADCLFRVSGKTPELWHPDTGRIEKVAAWSEENGRTRIPLHLDPIGSVFVVFRGSAPEGVHAVSLGLPAAAAPQQDLQITQATYGAGPGQSIDVTAKLAGEVHNGTIYAVVGNDFFGSDPAPDVVKQTTVNYTLNGQPKSVTLPEGGLFNVPMAQAPFVPARLVADENGGLKLEARTAGTYTVKMSDGQSRSVPVDDIPAAQEVAGSWTLDFPPNWGAPAEASLDKLISWSDSADSGIKYFSGTATYHKTVTVPAGWLGAGRRVDLDLGDVEVIAEVKLNGHDLGILWKPPYAVDITGAAHAGDNDLEVKVTNLWPNRVIGDQQLPQDCDRNAEGAIQSWPQWLLDGKPSPTGRLTFATWLHWKKDDPLFPSGLIGPVMLRPAVDVPVPSS